MVQPWNLGPPIADFSGLANLGNSFFGAYDKASKQRTLADLGKDIQSGNYAGAAQKALAGGDLETGLGLLKLGQTERDRAAEAATLQSWGSGGQAAASPVPASTAAVGNPNEIESEFIGGVRQAGLTNPLGLAAVAATGRAESGYSPGNANRAWNDPSQSGQPGQAGGIMSWRADRLQNLYKFAESRGERPGSISPTTQAAFFASEDPTLIPRLNAAKSAEEANQIMAGAWRYAGYDQPGGQTARRLALTKHYAGRFGSEAPSPVVAGGPVPPVGVQVAETEEDVRRLEGSLPPANQVAQAGDPRATMPASDANPAQFVMPGTGQPINEGIANDPQVRLWRDRLASPAVARSDTLRRAAERNLDLAVKDAERRASQNDPTATVRDYQFYRREEQAAGRQPISFQEFRESTATRINNNLGGSDKQVYETMEKGAEAASAAATGLQSIREARRAVEGGGYFGAGADLRLGFQKAAQGLGIASPDVLGKIVNTETFRSAIAPQIAATMKATVGSTQISNADRDFAEKAAGGSITLDQNSIMRLLGIMEKANNVIIDRHTKRLDKVYPANGKFERERALFGVSAPAPEEQVPAPATPQVVPAAQPRAAAPQGAPRTATNPNTGERIMLTPDGQWVPYS